MDLYSGRIKRDLSKRRFNKTDVECCCTGGSNLGCPFLRTNTHMDRVCILYRSRLKQTYNYHFKRVALCRKNAEPPIKRQYEICASKKFEATSSEEARRLFYQTINQGTVPNIVAVREGDIVEFEDLI